MNIKPPRCKVGQMWNSQILLQYPFLDGSNLSLIINHEPLSVFVPHISTTYKYHITECVTHICKKRVSVVFLRSTVVRSFRREDFCETRTNIHDAEIGTDYCVCLYIHIYIYIHTYIYVSNRRFKNAYLESRCFSF